MALIKTEGIVLRSKKFSETSLILDIYTKSLGMRSYIVSGVRKYKSKNSAASYQIMNIVDMIAYDKKNSDSLCRIKEAKSAHVYTDIPFNVIKSSIGMLMTEITCNSIQEKEDNPLLYQFLREWFIHLDDCTDGLGFKPVQFMIELSEHLGFYPNENYSELSPIFNMYEGTFVPESLTNEYCCNHEESRALVQLLKSNKNTFQFEGISNQTKASLFNAMEVYYKLHLEQFKNLKSIAILRQVLI